MRISLDHILWHEALIQSFNIFYAYKSVCILLKVNFIAFYGFVMLLYNIIAGVLYVVGTK